MLSLDETVGVDFETDPILRRPEYPPKPVGVSIAMPGEDPVYFAWGHPVGNNCTVDTACEKLGDLWKSGRPLVFHNSKFDIDVANEHLKLPLLDWRQSHDTLFLAFLDNPLARDLSLENLVGQVLRRSTRFKHGKLRDWILQNVPEAKRKPKEWEAWIARAPAHLVAERAKGDASSTLALFHKLRKKIDARGMWTAYERERRLLPCLLDSERRGIHVDLRRLQRDLPLYIKFIEEVDQTIRRVLKAKDLDVGSSQQLFEALSSAGKLTQIILTEKGNPSVSKAALDECIDDERLITLLKLRGALSTCVSTFMKPWVFQAEKTNGIIHTQWNQVRQPEGGGARTGRLSSTPNFQNIINPDRVKILLDAIDKYWPKLGMEIRAKNLPLIPALRDYLVADSPKDVLLVRDYSQQEMRILAHYENGSLLAKYHEEPTLDVHDAARDLIQQIMGVKLDRRPVKDTGFGLVYGLGVPGLAKKLGKSREEALQLRNAYLRAMPGIKDLNDEMRRRAAANLPIRTWGGREYFCEPPGVVKGKIRTFEYKLINVLIQGSAADNTKEATCRYWESKPQEEDARFMLTIHDETGVNAPKKNSKKAMKKLREAMESVEFDVPMLSDGKWGPTMARLKKFDDERTNL